jgi:hypothetical protein
MDLRTYLRQLVLLPKSGIEIKRDEYNYPEKTIAFLNSIRDHYTKYHTTFALFYPSPANTALLTLGGSVASLEQAVSLFGSTFPPPASPFQPDADFSNNLRLFLIATTLGFVVSPQVMSSVNGKRLITSELDKTGILNRIGDKGTPTTVVVAGVNTTVIAPPYWSVDLNGTNVLTASNVPTGADVIGIINDVLAEAYAYYDVSTLPVLVQGDIYDNGPYWVRKVIDKMNITRTPLDFLSTVSNTLGMYSGRGSFNCSVQGVVGISAMVDSLTDSTLAMFDDSFIQNFLSIFGDWFEAKTINVLDITRANYFFIIVPNDPINATEANPNFGDFYNTDMNSNTLLKSGVKYFIKNNVLNVIDTSGNILVPSSGYAFYYDANRGRVFIRKIITQKFLTRKDNGTIATSGTWLTSIITGISNALRNTWLNQPVTVSPYVKYFTAGKVTLDFLKAIQVRDSILKTDKGNDLYLFPTFLISDPAFLSDDPYNVLNLRVDSTSIKALLASAIDYISNQLFVQDIATLNLISVRFDQSISVNNAAKVKLDSENVKLTQISSDLDAKLLEAKRLFTVLDILKANLTSTPDPVLAYTQQVQAKIDSALADFTASEKVRLDALAQAKIASDKLASDLAIAETNRLAAVAETARLAAVAEAKRLADIETQRLAAVEAQRLADLAKAQMAVAVVAPVVTPAIVPMLIPRGPSVPTAPLTVIHSHKINQRSLLRNNRLAKKALAKSLLLKPVSIATI